MTGRQRAMGSLQAAHAMLHTSPRYMTPKVASRWTTKLANHGKPSVFCVKGDKYMHVFVPFYAEHA